MFRLADRTWLDLGVRPKHHLASQKRGGRPGAHSDRIELGDFVALRDALTVPADVMLEAKDEDLALFPLRRSADRLMQAGAEMELQ